MSKSKYLDLAGLTVYDGKIKEWIKSSVVDITDDEIRALFVVGPADNEIWYTSSDKNIVVPNFSNVFGSNLVNNIYNNDTGVMTFENNVTNIGDYAFYDCYLMTSIVIPNKVTSIGGCAFSECSSLKSITIPNSVSNIGWMAFSNCSSLNTINFIGSKEQWEKINKNADWKDEDVPATYVQCSDGQVPL